MGEKQPPQRSLGSDFGAHLPPLLSFWRAPQQNGDAGAVALRNMSTSSARVLTVKHLQQTSVKLISQSTQFPSKLGPVDTFAHEKGIY